MNASPAVASAVLFGALVATPAVAMMPNASVSSVNPLVVKADFVAGHEAIGGIPARSAAARMQSAEMASRYYDVDVALTLGALALASGAFVAVGMAGARRKQVENTPAVRSEGWREGLMQALEADLMKFSSELREAA